jgi:hypothetical protein
MPRRERSNSETAVSFKPFNGLRKLIRAGSFFAPAPYPFEFFNDLIGVHSFDQSAQRLEIAITAVLKRKGMDLAVP